jgi:hypothetical protein
MPIVYPQQYSDRYLNSFDRTKLAKYGGAFAQGQHVVLGAGHRNRRALDKLSADTDKALDEILGVANPEATVVTGRGAFEDAARSAVHTVVDAIPIVGQLIPNSWIDKACDWFGDNVWDPIKKFFSGKGFSDDDIAKQREKFMIDNEKKITSLARELLEADIKTGTGVVPTYIGKLRNGDSEQKQLADRLVKAITKPKFNKFIKDNSIPLSTTIDDAVKTYKGRKNKKQTFKATVRTKEDIVGNGFKCID